MTKTFSRRDFLKLSGSALGGLAFRPDFPRQPEWSQGKMARVASKQVDVRSRPDDEAPIVGNRFRDQLIHIYEELNPPDSPKYYNTSGTVVALSTRSFATRGSETEHL
jgi:hypothetical protein